MTLVGKAVVLGASVGLLCGFNPMVVAQEEQLSAMQVVAPERDSYLTMLKQRYGTQDARIALLAESNKLLADYALKADQVKNKRENLNYQISLGGEGKLLVREERRSTSGALSVRNKAVELFGITPFVRYDCVTGASQSCVLFNPQDGSAWLTIERNPQVAEQLSQALSFLIRNLQKG